MYKIHPKTLFIGQKIYYLPSCQSTNDEAAQRLAAGEAPEGTVVVTDRQTAGRGQRGNVWEAEPGQNLTFSVVLHPSFLAPAAQFRLNMAVSLGLHDALAPLLGDALRIKWPNDLYVQDRKIGGLLIENTVQGSSITTSVVGVGLNVNQTVFRHPAATSMLAETPLAAGYDLPGLLTLLLQSFEKRYLQLRAVHWTAVRAEYLAVLYRYQTWAEFVTKFTAEEQRFTGRIIGVDDTGRLQIETPEGVVRSFWFKEVMFG